MHIKKSDAIHIAREVQSSVGDTARQEKTTTPVSESQSTAAKQPLQVDSLRSQVLSIQNEVRELQTQLSFRQVQIAFLEQIKESSNWKNELQRFMQERFQGSAKLNDIQADTLSEFTEQAQKSIATINNNLLKKEIQLQNILATGMLSEDQVTVSLFKDLSNSSELFSKLKPETVTALLKQT